MRSASATPVDPSHLVPVAEPLRSLLPEGGLRRGSVVAVLGGPVHPVTGGDPAAEPDLGAGATSLLLALLSRASAAGTWSVVVGVPALSGSAAAEAGVDLARFALVPHPGPDLTAITAALLDGVDLVAVAGTDRLSAPERSRLTARARQRGAVLLPLGGWPGADVVLRCTGSRWGGLRTADSRPADSGPADSGPADSGPADSGPAGSGPAGSGPAGQTSRGRLRQREVLVSATGRRAAVPVSARLLLPSVAGPVGPVPGTAAAGPADTRREMAG